VVTVVATDSRVQKLPRVRGGSYTGSLFKNLTALDYRPYYSSVVECESIDRCN